MPGLDSLVPELQPAAYWLVDQAGAAGLQPRVTSAYRSPAFQAKLYRRFLAGRMPYTVAPPGQSAHEYGMAFDMVTQPMDALPSVGRLWEEIGGAYGGRSDPVHFQAGGFRIPREGGPELSQDPLEWAYAVLDAHPVLSMALEVALPELGAVDLAVTVLHYVRKGFR